MQASNTVPVITLSAAEHASISLGIVLGVSKPRNGGSGILEPVMSFNPANYAGD